MVGGRRSVGAAPAAACGGVRGVVRRRRPCRGREGRSVLSSLDLGWIAQDGGVWKGLGMEKAEEDGRRQRVP